ncbi:hypothetical protein AQUCO_00300515v1 [Aquilegia coerulea]|uniref:Uncharacterized protein n=1 Tax=Aquilegia coerulea TaxID=218851 RepID=A0A2G5EZH5_AQUCA|nr:hypothetical protein AQUCO_00300515v1 [Aquilegia coerulea]
MSYVYKSCPNVYSTTYGRYSCTSTKGSKLTSFVYYRPREGNQVADVLAAHAKTNSVKLQQGQLVHVHQPSSFSKDYPEELRELVLPWMEFCKIYITLHHLFHCSSLQHLHHYSTKFYFNINMKKQNPINIYKSQHLLLLCRFELLLQFF